MRFGRPKSFNKSEFVSIRNTSNLAKQYSTEYQLQYVFDMLYAIYKVMVIFFNNVGAFC